MEARITAVNDAAIVLPPRASSSAPIGRGRFVLYWMIAARRTTGSFALEHAIARAVEVGRPLVVLEPLRAGYRWASDRMHAFVLQGMADNAAAFARAGILEWSPSPRAALRTLIELNNRYAIDGRDPSSYNGIGWTLGRFDRPWGPERPIFGTVR